MILPFHRRLLPVLLVLAATVSAHAQSRDGSRWQGTPSMGGGSPMRPTSTRPRFTPNTLWWNDNVFKHELGLTNEQVAQLDKIWLELKPVQTERSQTLKDGERKLSLMIKQNLPLEKLVAQIDHVENINSAMNKARAIMLLQMRQVMSAAQRDRFDVLRVQWLAEMRMSPSRADQQPGPPSGPTPRRPF